MPNICAVVPAFNEATVIEGTLRGLAEAACLSIVVVDDGSSDRTAERAIGTGVCTVLRHPVNRGAGAAIQTGITWALRENADAVVLFDADGQHSPGDVPALVEPILRGECDVTLGSRFLGCAETIPRNRRWLLRAARWFTWLTSGVRLTDAHCGLQAFSRHAARQINLQTDDFGWASEIVEQVAAAGLRIREVPVTVRYTEYSRSKGQSSLNAVRIGAGVLARRLSLR